tara:strand:- start:421 stop:1827 length:1407 start_codon:yes stop_codon:yes gene_type:complete
LYFIIKIFLKIRAIFDYLIYLIKRPEILKKLDKLDSINNLKDKLIYAKKLCDEFPKHPLPYLKISRLLIESGNNKFYESLEKYDSVKNNWLKNNSKEQDEYIPLQQVIGSLGNIYPLEKYIKYKKLIKNSNKPILLLKKNYKLTNEYLFKYIKPYLNVISDNSIISNSKISSKINNVPLEFAFPYRNKLLPWDVATNLITQETSKDNKIDETFKFNQEEINKGRKILSKLGLPKNSWYVTLHIRQPGFRDNFSKFEDFRNSDPLTYIKAIKAIIKSGGFVILVGDKSMKKMPNISGLIDYAHSDEKNMFMDVFLAATCKFCLGTSSGFYAISMMFNIPVLVTNFLPIITYFSLTNKDMFLPKILKNKTNNSSLTIKEMFDPSISLLNGNHLKNNNIEFINNTEDDLEKATIEMLEKTIKKNFDNKDKYLNQFKSIIERYSIKYGGNKLIAYADTSINFLKKNNFLVND